MPKISKMPLRTHIIVQSDYLRAEMIGRETAEETGQFLREAAGAALKHGLTRVLIVVRESRAIFKVEDYNLSQYLKAMTERAAPEGGAYRIALVGDSSEAHAAHGYIEVLARQRGLAVRAFREETGALEWLRGK
jgi:predicted metal-dependent phosphoesterase TrpH